VNRFAINLVLGLIILAVAGQVMGHDFRYLSWNVSPYVLLVTAVALEHGWMEACLAAVLVLVLTGYGHPRIHSHLVLLFGSALFVGGLADRNRRRIRNLRLVIANQAETLVTKSEHLASLEKAKTELLHRLGERQTTTGTLHEVYRRLADEDLSRLPSAVVDVVSECIGAEQCSLYLMEGNSLTLAMSKGWTSTPDEARNVTLGDDLLSLAVREKRLRTLQEFPLERLRYDGLESGMMRLMAAPILHAGSGAVLGVLSVESLPFSLFNRSSAQLLETIAELAGKSLTAAVSPSGASGEWLSREFFRRRLRAELTAQNKGTRATFSYISLKLPNLEKTTPTRRPIVERALKLILQSILQPEDVRGYWETDTLGVLLLNTPPAMAQQLAHDLQKELQNQLGLWMPDLGLWRVEVACSTSEGIQEPDELVNKTLLAASPAQVNLGPALDFPEEIEELKSRKRYDLAIERLRFMISERPRLAHIRHLLIRTYLESNDSDSLSLASEQYSVTKLLEKP
jgi:hypothetical protein